MSGNDSDALTCEEISQLLEKIGVNVTTSQVTGWSQAQRDRTLEWALEVGFAVAMDDEPLVKPPWLP